MFSPRTHLKSSIKQEIWSKSRSYNSRDITKKNKRKYQPVERTIVSLARPSRTIRPPELRLRPTEWKGEIQPISPVFNQPSSSMACFVAVGFYFKQADKLITMSNLRKPKRQVSLVKDNWKASHIYSSKKRIIDHEKFSTLQKIKKPTQLAILTHLLTDGFYLEQVKQVNLTN